MRGLLAIAFSLMVATAGPALAQSGSTGGSVGKQGKSVSGGDGHRPAAPPRSREPAQRSAKPQQAAPARSAVAVGGRWRWTADCPSGHWNGGWDLTETGSGQFSGNFAGMTIGDAGSITNGRVGGGSLSFTRHFLMMTQSWNGRLTGGANPSVQGTITGNETCRFQASKS
jgi:hypothetical protein